MIAQLTLNQMIKDLKEIQKTYGNLEVEIYCKNCDCNDGSAPSTPVPIVYNGATVKIVINK